MTPAPLSRTQAAIVRYVHDFADSQGGEPCPVSVLLVDLVLTAQSIEAQVDELVARGLLYRKLGVHRRVHAAAAASREFPVVQRQWRFNDEDLARAINLRRAGWSYDRICTALGTMAKTRLMREIKAVLGTTLIAHAVKMTPEKLQRAIELRHQGWSYPRIATALGLSALCVSEHLIKALGHTPRVAPAGGWKITRSNNLMYLKHRDPAPKPKRAVVPNLLVTEGDPREGAPWFSRGQRRMQESG